MATILGHKDLAASLGWLMRFRDRFGVLCKAICGEGSSVPLKKVNEWRAGEIQKIILNYDPKNIYNADETGIFNLTLAVRGEQCRGGKESKLRLTTVLCCNSTGTDKLLPLIIEKSKKKMF